MGRTDTQALLTRWHKRLCQEFVDALYVHLPFCARKCAYCDFASWATRPDDPGVRAYLETLDRLIAEVASSGLLDCLQTAYVGGGTPTLVGEALVDLVRSLRALAPSLEELSCEANPDSLTPALAHELAEGGLTRLSLGVQSLQDDELRALGRIHTAEAALDALAAAVSAGVDVSCDLMCAIPLQSQQSWLHTLAGVVETGVGHVSVYPLQIEEGTLFDLRYGDEDQPWNDTSVQAQRMLAASELLAEQGFLRYEVASYAKDGAACRHNEAYWTARPYLGVGTHASSMLTREAYELLRTVATQLPELRYGVTRVRLTCTDTLQRWAHVSSWRDLSFEMELLDDAQAAAEDLMLGMRMACGADPGLVHHAAGILGQRACEEAFAWCLSRKLVRQSADTWQPTHTGWLLGNELYGRLWDLAPSAVEELQV